MLCVGAGLSGFSAGGDTGAIISSFAQGLLTLGRLAFEMYITAGYLTGIGAGPYRRLLCCALAPVGTLARSIMGHRRDRRRNTGVIKKKR